MFLYINTDGGCIDNTSNPPGLASASYVARAANKACTYMGGRSTTFNGTNNDAEYRAVLLALEDLAEWDGVEGVQIRCDSQLVISQITGAAKAKNVRIREYVNRVRRLLDSLPFHCAFKLIPREQNQEADWLCTHALFRGPKTDRMTEMPPKVSRERLKKEAA